jgi:hypothetical protein
MRRRYRRRTGTHYGTSGHFMFGGTGWLFADLLLALALAFLLATTVGAPPPPIPKVHPSPKPTGSSSAQPQPPPLQLDPVHLTFTIADPVGLASGSPSAVAAVRATILQITSGIKERSAGLVLLFGGNGNGAQDPPWEQVDQGVENVLKSLSGPGQLFHLETRYMPFLNIVPPGQFAMDIYLFAGTG